MKKINRVQASSILGILIFVFYMIKDFTQSFDNYSLNTIIKNIVLAIIGGVIFYTITYLIKKKDRQY